MIAKLKNSLTAKIFLVTCLLLTAVCVLTYGLIAQLMPLTYTADQERMLVAQADRLAKQLEEYTLADCESLLSQFTFQYGVPVSIQDSAGRIVGGIDPSDIMPTGENGRWEMLPTHTSDKNLQSDNENSDYIEHCVETNFLLRIPQKNSSFWCLRAHVRSIKLWRRWVASGPGWLRPFCWCP